MTSEKLFGKPGNWSQHMVSDTQVLIQIDFKIHVWKWREPSKITVKITYSISTHGNKKANNTIRVKCSNNISAAVYGTLNKAFTLNNLQRPDGKTPPCVALAVYAMSCPRTLNQPKTLSWLVTIWGDVKGNIERVFQSRQNQLPKIGYNVLTWKI